MESNIQSLKAQRKNYEGDSLVREEVTSEDIADIVSNWTGIPVTRMLQSEKEKLLHMEEILHKRVVGQDEAIAAVSNAVRRSRAVRCDESDFVALIDVETDMLEKHFRSVTLAYIFYL